MSRTPTITGLGSALLDIEYSGTAEMLAEMGLSPADTVFVDAAEQRRLKEFFAQRCRSPHVSGGGSSANSLTVAALAGVRAYMLSMVGDDHEGRQYREDLLKADVRLVSPAEVEGETGSCLVVIDETGERTMSSYLGCCLNMSDAIVDEDIVGDSDWLLLEGYCLAGEGGTEALFKAQRLARENGVRIALSLSSAILAQEHRATIERLLEIGLDLVLGNEAEALAATGTENVEAAVDQLASLAPMAVATLSERGALLATGGESWHERIEVVQAIDALGAGDAFAGALLATLALGYPLREAGHLGCLAGRIQVQTAGPRLGSEGRGEISRHFQQLRQPA